MPGPGVRISGGELRGRVLEVAAGVRPTEGRVREALFSIWQERTPGARFLDLFAGSGAVALEALSRGADSALLVEKDPRACKMAGEACRKLGGRSCRVWRGTLPATLADIGRQNLGPFDLVYVDPPYVWNDHAKLLGALLPLLAPDGEVAVEHSSRTELPVTLPGWQLLRERAYGETILSFFESAPGFDLVAQ